MTTQLSFPNLGPRTHLLKPKNFALVVCGQYTSKIDLATTNLNLVTCSDCLRIFNEKLEDIIEHGQVLLEELR